MCACVHLQLVRTEAVPLLRKVFWGGGSVALASSRENFHVLKCRVSSSGNALDKHADAEACRVGEQRVLRLRNAPGA